MTLATRGVVQRKRFTADRFQRIWAIVERIDHEPGLSRRQLAEEFALSERQLQADLITIRDEMGLPLRKQQGYRLAPRPFGDDELGLADAIALARLAHANAMNPLIDGTTLRDLLSRMADAFPVRYQPFARAVLCTALDGVDRTPAVLVFLADALLRQESVELRLAKSSTSSSFVELTVDLQLLLPHGEAWYLIGYCHERRREVMIGLNQLDPSFISAAEIASGLVRA